MRKKHWLVQESVKQSEPNQLLKEYQRRPIVPGVKSTNMHQWDELESEGHTNQRKTIAKMWIRFTMRSRKKRILGLYKIYRIFREGLMAGWRRVPKRETHVKKKKCKRQEKRNNMCKQVAGQHTFLTDLWSWSPQFVLSQPLFLLIFHISIPFALY